jgi:hypothetical protein
MLPLGEPEDPTPLSFSLRRFFNTLGSISEKNRTKEAFLIKNDLQIRDGYGFPGARIAHAPASPCQLLLKHVIQLLEGRAVGGA